MGFWFQLHLDPPSHLPWRFVLRYLPEAPELFFPHGGLAEGDTPFVNQAGQPLNRAKVRETVIRPALIALQGQGLAMRPSDETA
jgi:hypothetical protein